MSVRSISDDEVEQFHCNGWVHLPGLVDPGIAEKLLDRAADACRSQETVGDFGEIVERNFRPFPGIDRSGPIGAGMLLCATMGRNIARLLRVSRVRLLADGYLLKTPEREGVHAETLFHQDYPGNPVDRSGFLTVWISLHDMPPEAGVMRFYNGSHRLGVLGQVFADGIDLRARCADLQPEDLSPPLSLRAGDATAHHSLTVHGAPPNQTSRHRWAYNILYMDADCRYTGSPGLFPKGVKVEPLAVLDHPAFPLVPTADGAYRGPLLKST